MKKPLPSLGSKSPLIFLNFLVVGDQATSLRSPATMTIICDNDYIGVVRDPVKREYICVPSALVKEVNPTLIKPNKKAIEIVLDSEQLSEQDQDVLNQASL